MPSPSGPLTAHCPSPPSNRAHMQLIEARHGPVGSADPSLLQESLTSLARCAVGGTRALECAVVDLVQQVKDIAHRLATVEAEKARMQVEAAAQADEVSRLQARVADAEHQLARMADLERRVEEHHDRLHTTRWEDVDLTAQADFDTECVYRLRSGEMDGAAADGWVYVTRVLPRQLFFEPASSAATFFGRIPASRKSRWEYTQRSNDLESLCSYPVAGVVVSLQRAWL